MDQINDLKAEWGKQKDQLSGYYNRPGKKMLVVWTMVVAVERSRHQRCIQEVKMEKSWQQMGNWG